MEFKELLDMSRKAEVNGRLESAYMPMHLNVKLTVAEGAAVRKLYNLAVANECRIVDGRSGRRRLLRQHSDVVRMFLQAYAQTDPSIPDLPVEHLPPEEMTSRSRAKPSKK